MNAKNKNTHTSIDQSLEVFSPFPAYHDVKLNKIDSWLRYLAKLINHKS